MRLLKTLLPLSIFLFLFLVLNCHEKKQTTSQVFAFDENMLREGDIVFRRGVGMASRMVLVADAHGVFSHIGIVVNDMGQWKVVHAVPGEPDFEGDPDRVKLEKVCDFFTPQRTVRGAVMRVKGDSIKNVRAAQHAMKLFKKHLLFDHSYDCKDSTKLYCSELIQFVYDREGVDLLENRISRINIPGLKGDFILPSDIQKSTVLNLIYDF